LIGNAQAKPHARAILAERPIVNERGSANVPAESLAAGGLKALEGVLGSAVAVAMSV
jgi:hypothetical protein